MDATLERIRPESGPSLPRTKRARACTRVILVPLLAAATVLVPAVAAQATPPGHAGPGHRRTPAVGAHGAAAVPGPAAPRR